MKALTRKDFTEWCDKRGLESVDREWPYYRDSDHHSFLVKLPDRPSQVLALARWCFPDSNEGRSFQGAMIWLRDWGIWNEPDEEMGTRIIGQMRGALGENRELAEAPGHIFSEQEFVDARAFWTLPMVLGWDAMLFPDKADYFVFSSHDEVVCFVVRERRRYVELLEQMKTWKPEESAWYFR